MINKINKSSLTNLVLAGVLSFSSANSKHLFDQDYEITNTNSIESTVQTEKSWDDFYFEQKTKNPEGKIEYEGGMKIKFLEDGKEIKIPSWMSLGVDKPNKCARYANNLALKLGYRLDNLRDAWDLHKYNESVNYNPEELKTGDIITLYNPKSRYKGKGRIATHAATYLGEDESGKLYFAEQRGSSTRISTIEDFTNSGMRPVKIIKTEKITSVN